jgi:DNA-binding transcriptional regulator GbsR (MarR family)
MPNTSNKSPARNKALTAAECRFIDDVARLLTPWGVPQAAARLYGYLLLFPEPVSLDQMTEDLVMSKSSASVAARLLEKYRMVLRHGERGSKRVLYEVSEDYDGMMMEQNRLLDALAELMEGNAGVAASGSVQKRLEEMAAFYRMIREVMDAALRRWRAGQAALGGAGRRRGR